MNKLSLIFSLVLAGVTVPLYAAPKYAAPNPVIWDAMVRYVTKAISSSSDTLTSDDWAAVCTSGTPTSVSGCYGNIASAEFALLNGKLAGFSDQVNIPVASMPNSIFIQQYNGASAVLSEPGQSPQVMIPSSSAPAMCSYFTTAGANLAINGMINGDSQATGGSIAYIEANDTPAIAGDSVADDHSVSPVVVAYYVLCIGLEAPQPSVPSQVASLSGLIAN